MLMQCKCKWQTQCVGLNTTLTLNVWLSLRLDVSKVLQKLIKNIYSKRMTYNRLSVKKSNPTYYVFGCKLFYITLFLFYFICR